MKFFNLENFLWIQSQQHRPCYCQTHKHTPQQHLQTMKAFLRHKAWPAQCKTQQSTIQFVITTSMFQYHTDASNMHYHRLPQFYPLSIKQILYDISKQKLLQVLNPEVMTLNHESPYVQLTVLESPCKMSSGVWSGWTTIGKAPFNIQGILSILQSLIM